MALVTSVVLAQLIALPLALASQATLQAPAAFEENRGQVPSATRFVYRGSDDALLFTPNSLRWARRQVEIRFPGSNSAAVSGVDRAAGRLNIIHGRDPAGWKFDVPQYGSLQYRQLYPGTDVVFKPNPGPSQMNWTITLQPGADLTRFRMLVDNIGANPQSISNGVWYTGGKFAVFIVSQPAAYQVRNGARVNIPMMFRVEPDQSLAIDPVSYDNALPLVLEGWIGPVPSSGALNAPANILLDRTGNFFASTTIVQTDAGTPDQPLCYPPSSSYEARGSCADLSFSRWSPSGELQWTTILGGASDDWLWDVALHASGDVFLTGNTYSTDLPVPATAAQPAYAGARRDPAQTYYWAAQGDAFLARLNGATGELRAATYFGGEQADAAGRITVDAAGNAYMAGVGAAGLRASSGAYRPAAERQAGGYVVKWDSSGNRFGYVALLETGPGAAAVNREGEIYFASPGLACLPVTRDLPAGRPRKATDSYFAVLRGDGSALRFATYVAWPSAVTGEKSTIWSLAADSRGRAWLAASGASESSSNGDLAVARIDPAAAAVSAGWVASRVNVARLSVDTGDQAWLIATAGGGAVDTGPDPLQAGNCGWSYLLARFDAPPLPAYATWMPRSSEVRVSDEGRPYTLTFSRTAGPLQAWRVEVGELDLSPPRSTRVACVVSAALRIEGGSVATGELVRVLGGGFGPAEPQSAQPDPDGRFPWALAGVTVRFNGTPAPVLSVARGDALVEVPDLGGVLGPIGLEVADAQSGAATLTAQASPTSFAFFSADGTGYGQAAALNEDGSVNSPSNPAPLGSVVSFFGTGGGALNPAQEAGRIALEAAPIVSPVIAGIPSLAGVLTIEYAGVAPFLLGVNQINVRLPDALPDSIPADAVGVSFYFGTRGKYFIWPSPLVTIAVRK